MLLGGRGFTANVQDPRIFVEPGVGEEALARVRSNLDACIQRVERAHGQSFRDRVRVYIASTQESFNKRTAASPQGIARGAVFADRLFLSPRAFSTSSSVGVLTHELSHLHFRQILGTSFTTEVPGWFQEGMAVYVADGGGAEPVSREQAIASIRRGASFVPEAVGSTIPRGAAAHGLSHHMFYRQSELFVAYLSDTYPASFAEFMRELLSGIEFQVAFEKGFGLTVTQAWDAFFAAMRTMEVPEPARVLRPRSSG